MSNEQRVENPSQMDAEEARRYVRVLVDNSDLISVRDAWRNLGVVVDTVASGRKDKMILTKRGKMVVAVVPLAAVEASLEDRLDEATAILMDCDSPDGFCGEMSWELRERIERFLARSQQPAQTGDKK